MQQMFLFGRTLLKIALCGALVSTSAFAQDFKEKAKAKLPEIKEWAKQAAVVDAVKAFNSAKPAELKEMTQDKWKALSVVDPILKGLTKNPAGELLKSKKGDFVAEAFLNGADGCKVALLGKTTSWCHSGKPKHDKPMAGEDWIGDTEVDESSGVKSIQVSVPVLDGGKSIGSLVVGLNTAKL